MRLWHTFLRQQVNRFLWLHVNDKNNQRASGKPRRAPVWNSTFTDGLLQRLPSSHKLQEAATTHLWPTSRSANVRTQHHTVETVGFDIWQDMGFHEDGQVSWDDGWTDGEAWLRGKADSLVRPEEPLRDTSLRPRLYSEARYLPLPASHADFHPLRPVLGAAPHPDTLHSVAAKQTLRPETGRRGPPHRPRPRRGRAAGSGPRPPSPPRGAAELAALILSVPPQASAASPGGGTVGSSSPTSAHGPGRSGPFRPRESAPRGAQWGGGLPPDPVPAAQQCRQPAPGRAGPPCARSIAAPRLWRAALPWAPSPPRLPPPPPTEPPSSSAPSPCQPPPRPSPYSTPVPEPRVTRAPAPPQTWRHWQRSSRSRWTEVSAAAAPPRPSAASRRAAPSSPPPRVLPVGPPRRSAGSSPAAPARRAASSAAAALPAPRCVGPAPPAVAEVGGEALPRGTQVGGRRRAEMEEIKLCPGKGAGVALISRRWCRRRGMWLRGHLCAPPRAPPGALRQARLSVPLCRLLPAGLPLGRSPPWLGAEGPCAAARAGGSVAGVLRGGGSGSGRPFPATTWELAPPQEAVVCSQNAAFWGAGGTGGGAEKGSVTATSLFAGVSDVTLQCVPVDSYSVWVGRPVGVLLPQRLCQ